MIRKLKSRAGESIAESLVAILIVAVASMMFAGMVQASGRIIQTTTNSMHNFYTAQNELESRTGSHINIQNQKVITISLDPSTQGTATANVYSVTIEGSSTTLYLYD